MGSQAVVGAVSPCEWTPIVVVRKKLESTGTRGNFLRF